MKNKREQEILNDLKKTYERGLKFWNKKLKEIDHEKEKRYKKKQPKDFITKSKYKVKSNQQEDVKLMCNYVSDLTTTKKKLHGRVRFEIMREIDRVTHWLYNIQFDHKDVYENTLVIEEEETVGNYFKRLSENKC